MLAYSGNRVCAPLVRFEILAAIVAAVALIGCSGVGTRAPATDITGSLTPRRAATNALSVDWTLSRECVAGGVAKGAIKGVSSATATTETHALSGTSGTVTFSADAFSTEGATVSLACGDTTVVKKSIAAPATTGDSPPPSNPTDSSDRGSLALSRGGDYNVTAAWSLTRTCARSPQLRATATGSTAEIVDLTGTSGSESLSTAKYRSVSATVELRCDGDTLATATIAAPAGSLRLTRGSGNSLEVAWALNPSCSAGEIAAAPADGSEGDSRTISGTGGNVDFTDGKYKSQGASVTLDCNGARMDTATIAAPAITGGSPPPTPAIAGTIALSRGDDYNVTAAWSLSETCARNPQLRATATGSTADIFDDLTGTSGSESLSTAKYRNMSATVELRCDGVVLATKTIAAPTGSLTLTRGTGNSVKVAWTLNPSCAAGTVTTSPDGETQTHDASISGTSGNVETTASAYTTKGADVELKCNDAEIASASILAPTTLTLSRGGDYNVTAAWSLSETCARNPRIRATASGSTADIFNLTGTSGSESLSTAKYRNVSATVELRCDGVVLITETIAAPTGSLTLTRGTGNSVKVAWTLNPSCAAGTVTTSPDGGTQTHDFAINGTSGNVETTASAYTTKGAAVKLKCNDAEIASASILAPITGTLTVGRGGPFSAPFADWTLSRECPANGTISASAANGFYNNIRYTLSGTSGNAAWALTPSSVTVTLSCEGRTLATATIPAES